MPQYAGIRRDKKMLAWIKKNWLKILIGALAIFFCYSLIDLAVGNQEYKNRIKKKDEDIARLEQDIEESEKRVNFFIEDARKWHLAAMEKEEKMKEKEEEIKEINEERKKLEEKIKEMPASKIVIRTIEILECEEIREQQQGILFSLSCARKNLAYLEDFTLVERKSLELEENYNLAKGEISDLKNVLLDKDGVILEKDSQLVKKDGIIKNWQDKFNLSEKKNRKSWWKGLKTGGTIGTILGVLLGLFLGGK
jgi:chromosome segregation ATPase